MYKVFCDGHTLHDPSLNDVHFQLISPVVTQEVNKAGSFTFTIPAAHANANALRRLSSVLEVYDDSKLIFRGRILNDTRDWDDSRKVVCESDIAVLNDTTQRPYTFTGTVAAYISQLIGTHNAMAPADKQFTVGTVNVSGSVSIEQTGYSSTWHELEEKILNQFSGYLFVTWTGSANRIDFLADSPYHCEQKISFGENLLDITRESKGENIITALIPLGAKAESTGEPLTIKSVNGGIDYITNASAVEAYGLIFGTETWDTVTNAAELLVRGQARLAELSQGVTTITLTAADLHLLDNEISSFDFLSYVTVEDLAHGVNGTMLVTKKTTNLTDPAQGKLTIGRESSGISKYYAETSDQIQTIRQTYATQEQVDTVNTTLQSEIQPQADKIALVVSESAGSYVIKSAEIVAAINESGSTVKISADHIALTGSVIVSLINGGSTTINGDKITTGTLNGDRIITGTLSADKITTGTIQDAQGNNSWNLNTGYFKMKNGELNITIKKTYNHEDYDATDVSTVQNYINGVITSLTDAQWEKYDFIGDRDITNWNKTRIEQMIALQKDTEKTVVTLVSSSVDPNNGMYSSIYVPALGTSPGVGVTGTMSGARLYSNYISAKKIKALRQLLVDSGGTETISIDDTNITLKNATYTKTITASGPTVEGGNSSSDTSVPNNTITELASFDIEPGTYIITATARFASNATGARRFCIRSGNVAGISTNLVRELQAYVAAASGATTCVNICGIQTFNSSSTLHLYVQQHSGGALGTSWAWHYVRLA